MSRSRKTFLIISQTFVPDPASVGQHMADVAIEMARRGHRVLVYTSARGYENPNIHYPKREMMNGVEIRRFSMASFGKKSIFLRVLGTASFLFQSLWVCMMTPSLTGIFFSTSPPLIGLAACAAKLTRGVPIAYWAMDLNPDQLIAMGKISPHGPIAKALEAGNSLILRTSSIVIALDRFMAERLRKRAPNIEKKMLVMPPWPHEGHVEPVAHAENPFRARYHLDADKFVIMYSGNHSPANPLRTLLDAAVRFKDDPKLKFMFIGGGLGKKEVEAVALQHGLKNVISLPYQPLADLRYSLSAADVHVVSLGGDMVGIVHPCKIYGAMTVGRPILYLGPRPSHIADILDQHAIGRHVEHGDVNGAVEAINWFRSAPPAELARMGNTARQALSDHFTQAMLCGRFCDQVERALGVRGARGRADFKSQKGSPDANITRPVAAAR